MSMCLCMQCSKKSPNPAETLFSFIMIAFIYLLSIAFSYVGNGEHLQLSAVALFVVAYTYLYLVMYAGWGQSYAARFS